MSGTASMGTLPSDQMPSVTAAPHSSTTNQRRSIEKARIALSMTSPLVFVRRFALAKLGLERESIRHCDLFARRQTGHDFNTAIILAACLDYTWSKSFVGPHEHSTCSLDGLECGLGNGSGDGLWCKANLRRDEFARF